MRAGSVRSLGRIVPVSVAMCRMTSHAVRRLRASSRAAARSRRRNPLAPPPPSAILPGAGDAQRHRPRTTGDDRAAAAVADGQEGRAAERPHLLHPPARKPEKRAFLWLAVNAGSVLEDDDQNGLAHFDEHMAFNGTKRFPKAEIVNYLEKHRHALRRRPQRVHELRRDRLSARGADRQARESSARASTSCATGPATSPTTRRRSKRSAASCSRSGGSGAAPYARLRDKHSRRCMFKGTRYADRNPIGEPEILKKATARHAVPVLQGLVPPRPDGGDRRRRHRSGRWSRRRSRTRGSATSRTPTTRAREVQGWAAEGRRHAGLDRDRSRAACSPSVAIHNLCAHRAEATLQDFRRLVAEQLYRQVINERFAVLRRRPDAAFVNALVRDVLRRTARPMTFVARGDRQERQGRGRAAHAVHRGPCASSATASPSPRSTARKACSRATSTQIVDQHATLDSRELIAELDQRNYLDRRVRDRPEDERDLSKKCARHGSPSTSSTPTSRASAAPRTA